MVKKLYARWMYGWETRLTTRDENRVVRPLEWGFDWLRPFLDDTGLAGRVERLEAAGEEVVLLGRQGAESITAEDHAAWAGTIPWEIFTSIAARVERIKV